MNARGTALLFIVGFCLCGVLLLWIALAGLLPTLQAVRTNASLISFRPNDAIALGPAISFFAFGAMTLLPDGRGDAVRTGKRAQAQRSNGAATLLLAVAFVGIALSFVASPIAQTVVSRIVEGRGYLRCPPPKLWDRHAPIRWTPPGLSSHCP